MQVVVQAINKIFGTKATFLSILEKNITEVINQVDESEITEIEQKLTALQQELLRLANNKQDYSIIANEIYKLRDEKESAMAKNAGYASQKQRMEDMTEFLKQQSTSVKEYD